jgi:cytosine permease
LTSLAWSIAGALVGVYLVRVIAALMKVFPVFPAAMLATAMILTIKGLGDFRPSGIDPESAGPVPQAGPHAAAMVMQLVFGFFATAGAASADWGAASRDARDVRLGGWVGVAFASWVVATLAMLTIAGALGMSPPAVVRVRPPSASALTFHDVVRDRIGGRLGGVMLLVFGLASMAPAVYASHVFGHRFAAAWPRLSRLRWTLVGAVAAWPLVATGLAGRLEPIFGIMGAASAPLVGAIAADYSRTRGIWPGPRRGVNQAGLVAWAVGLTVGLLPTVAHAWGRADTWRLQPAAVLAFLAGYVVYLVLARFGAESPVVATPEQVVAAETP